MLRKLKIYGESGWFLISQVGGSIHEYQNQSFIRRSNSFFFHGGSEGLYASKLHIDPDKKGSSSPEDNHLNGKSFFRGDDCQFPLFSVVTVTGENKYSSIQIKPFCNFSCISDAMSFSGLSQSPFEEQKSAEKKNKRQQKRGLVEAIIVEEKDGEKIGGSYLHSAAICCTPDLSKDGSCKVGQVIIHQDPNNPYNPQRIQTFFEGQNEETTMALQTVVINRTGMYYLYFMFCDPELTGTMISGRTVWRNPEGYLPGKKAPLMTFLGLMSLAYVGLGVVWFLWFVQNWKDIIQLHYHIAAVIGLGMCETAL
ncbi:hypothetical protein CRYUN_Cryun05aG0124300 [Craigia yunnanensis]